MLTHLVSTLSSDEDPFVLCLWRCTAHRDLVHLREEQDFVAQELTQGASYPSLFGPDTSNKEQCCGEATRAVGGGGVAVEEGASTRYF